MEEKACQSYFNQTDRQGVDGKFIVKLPFKTEIKELGNFYSAALRRFFSLEKRFKFNPIFKLEYIQFMEEYIELNHIEIVLENEKKKSA